MINTLEIMQADIYKALDSKALGNKALDNIAIQRDKSKSQKSNPTIKPTEKAELDDIQISRIIEMAWEDRTPFDVIERNYGLSEPKVIELMRHELKSGSFKLWRKRVTGRATKHQIKRNFKIGRAYCKTQYKPR